MVADGRGIGEASCIATGAEIVEGIGITLGGDWVGGGGTIGVGLEGRGGTSIASLIIALGRQNYLSPL